MSDDPFRQWVRREVSELDHMANKHDPQFLAFLAGVIGEKVDFPPVCSFYSQALQISKSLGLSMSYEHIFRSRLEPLNKRGLTR